MSPDTHSEPNRDETGIDSRISRGYWIRSFSVMMICLVLGVWGIYDYVWAIPQQSEFSERRDLSQRVKEMLE